MRGEGSDRAHRTPTAQTVMKFVVCRKTVAGKEGFFFISAQFESRQPLVQKIYTKQTKRLAGFSCAFGSLLQMASISESPINMFNKMIKGPDRPIHFV